MTSPEESLGDTLIDEMVKRVGDHAKIGLVSDEATASNLHAWICFMRRVKDKYPNVSLLAPQFASGTAPRPTGCRRPCQIWRMSDGTSSCGAALNSLFWVAKFPKQTDWSMRLDMRGQMTQHRPYQDLGGGGLFLDRGLAGRGAECRKLAACERPLEFDQGVHGKSSSRRLAAAERLALA